jgi:methionine synthase II (cobalamin-independent)
MCVKVKVETMKCKVQVETHIVYECVLEFDDEDTTEEIQKYLEVELSDYSEIFEDKNITDNYTDVTEVEPIGESCA